MKLRAGFVSNSSSSSFVFLGVDIAPLDLPRAKQVELWDIDELDHVTSDKIHLVGHNLLRYDDEDWPPTIERWLGDLTNDANQLYAQLKELGVDQFPRLYAGKEYS